MLLYAKIDHSSHFFFLSFFPLVIACSGKDQEDEEEESEAESAEGDEDESDLDLAWKMLDVARAIVEKDSGDTMEKVDILSALAEVALERGFFFFGFSKYFRIMFVVLVVAEFSRGLALLIFVCLFIHLRHLLLW